MLNDNEPSEHLAVEASEDGNTWWTWDRGAPRKPGSCFRWYRTRLAPTPPAPPEGWELLPDGTGWQDGFQRTTNFAKEWNRSSWQFEKSVGETSGHQAGNLWVWYARRIEPEPQWVPTRRVRIVLDATYPDGSKITQIVEGVPTHRELRRGDETKWEPVQ